MSRRILCLCTGGTICMQQSSKGLLPSSGMLPLLLQRFKKDGLTLDIKEYQPLIDSSCIGIKHWNQIIADISENYNYYHGFIVIHGTDTMAYSASMLAFALTGLSKPVVFTGAQLPLTDQRSDGWINFSDALVAACDDELSEVVLIFNRLMLRACRAQKVNTSSFASFASPNEQVLAFFDVKTIWRRELWRKPKNNFVAKNINPEVQVCSFMLTPGASVDLFSLQLTNNIPHGLILLSYGNGNAPDNPVFYQALRAASAAGCLILNLTQANCGSVEQGAYAASQLLYEAGVLSGLDITVEAALAKLTFLCSQNLQNKEARVLLSQNMVGEISI